VIHQISRVLMLSHLWWGRMHLLLGIHPTLVWNRDLQHSRGWLLQILLWDLLSGRWRWRTWRLHGIFHSFKVRNLGEMVSIMTMLTIKSTGEVCPEVVFFIPPLAFFVISPLMVMVSPNRLVLLGVISPWSWVIIVSFFPFLFGIIRLMGRIFYIQLFKILKFLNGKGLNKVIPSMWLSLWRSNGMWRTRKWKIQIFLCNDP
jgi:hypothetical protein